MPTNDINTFADCEFRIEEIRTPDEEIESLYIEMGFCHIGARVLDYSLCIHPDTDPSLNPESPYDSTFCEVACREGVCPLGFRR